MDYRDKPGDILMYIKRLFIMLKYWILNSNVNLTKLVYIILRMMLKNGKYIIMMI